MNPADMTIGQRVYVREMTWASGYSQREWAEQVGIEQRTEQAWSRMVFVRVARKPVRCDTCGRRVERGEVHASGDYGYPHWCAGCVRATEPPWIIAPKGYPHERTITPEVSA